MQKSRSEIIILVFIVFLMFLTLLYQWVMMGVRSGEERAYRNLVKIVENAYPFRLEKGYYPINILELYDFSIEKKVGDMAADILSLPRRPSYRDYKLEIIYTKNNSLFLAVAYPAVKKKWIAARSFCVVHDFNSGKPTSVNSPIRYDKKGTRITECQECLKLKELNYPYPPPKNDLFE